MENTIFNPKFSKYRKCSLKNIKTKQKPIKQNSACAENLDQTLFAVFTHASVDMFFQYSRPTVSTLYSVRCIALSYVLCMSPKITEFEVKNTKNTDLAF